MGIHIMPPLYKTVIEPPPGPAYGEPVTEHFHPDPYLAPSPTTCDGAAARVQYGVSWSNLHDLAGTSGIHNTTRADILFSSWSTTGMWYRLQRILCLFDTGSIPVGSLIVSAILHAHSSGKFDSLGVSPRVNVFTSNPASDIEIVAADYQAVGDVPLSDDIDYDDWDDAGFNSFPFNADGLATIVPGGITKLALRESRYDAPDVLPSWSSYKHVWFYIEQSEGAEGGWTELEVTYQPPL